MNAAGLGTAQDYVEAAHWFDTAVSKNHKYAQYSLAGLYYRGRVLSRLPDGLRTIPPICKTASSLCPL
jgi:TPR repeat protein